MDEIDANGDFNALEICLELEQNENNVLSKLNNLLTSGKTCTVGLRILNKILHYTSKGGISQHFHKWLTICTSSNTEVQYKELKLEILGQIIALNAENDSFAKKFLSDFYSDTLQHCLASSSKKSLQCLTQLMKVFPSCSVPHRKKIESFLHNLLETNTEDFTDVALAIHQYLQTGPAGTDGINYTNNYFNYLNGMCGTVHTLYNTLFDGVDEFTNYQKIDGLPLSFPVENNEIVALRLSFGRLLNCITVLKVLISRSYSTQKRIVPGFIIEVITRGLSLHLCWETECNTRKSRNQSVFVMKLQIELLKLLEIFITGYSSSLLPFSQVITNTLTYSLKKTSDCKCFNSLPLYKLRAYRTLNKWITATKNVNLDNFIETIYPLVVKDSFLVTDCLPLSIQKNKIHFEESNQTGEGSPRDLRLKERIINESLETIKNFLFVAWSKHTKFQEIVPIILKFLSDAHLNRKNKILQRYPKMKIKLYEILALLEQDSSFKIPINQICQILSNGVGKEYEISKFASQGLQAAKQYCYLSYNSLPIQDFVERKNVFNLNGPDSEVDMIVANGNHEQTEDLRINVDQDMGSSVIEESGSNIQEDKNTSNVVDKETTIEDNSPEDLEEPVKKKQKQDLDSILSLFQDIPQDTA